MPSRSTNTSTQTTWQSIEFTTSQNWQVPAGVTRIRITGTGGGGSGGSSNNASPYANGGGGGSGLYTTRAFNVTPLQTLTITIGAGGAATTPGFIQDGNSGGATSISPLLSIAGGGGGRAPTGNGIHGVGGTGSSTGQTGNQSKGGDGGYGIDAVGGSGGFATPNGAPGSQTAARGSGGGGGATSSNLAYQGGAGQAGWVMIEWEA